MKKVLDKNIKVILRNLKPIETGIFTSNYIIYEVFTEITENILILFG